MNTRIKRNIIATLLRAKRTDLANVVASTSKVVVAQDEPEPEDFVIQDKYSGVDVGQVEGKHLGHFKDTDEALKAIFKKMEHDKVFPNIWHESDHGNLDLMIVKKKGGKFDYTYASNRVTSAYMATKEIKQLIAANAALGKAYRPLDSSLNRLADELQTPLSSENFNRVDRKAQEVETQAESMLGAMENLLSVLKHLRETIQLQRGRSE